MNQPDPSAPHRPTPKEPFRLWGTSPEGNRAARLLGVGLVLVLATLVVSAVVPNFGGCDLCRSRGAIRPNESAAIATLKNIHAAQEQGAASGRFDVDGDGQGGFGYFHELSRPAAGSAEIPASPAGETDTPERTDAADKPGAGPWLSMGFRRLLKAYGGAGGTVRRSGYHFQLYLRRSDGIWVPELDQGGRPDLPQGMHYLEDNWLCMAWPDRWGRTGRRMFLVDSQGIVLAAKNSQSCYADGRTPVPGWAGFTAPNTLAAGTDALDGQRWEVVR